MVTAVASFLPRITDVRLLSFAGSTVARSHMCAIAAASDLLRPARSPTTCVATQGRSPTCVTAVEKPLPSPVLSLPIPENTQVRGNRVLWHHSRPGKGALLAEGLDVGNNLEICRLELPPELSSSSLLMFFPSDSSLGSSFSH